MRFTTRPELCGTFGMVASTHWIASAVGMKLLEAGGSAFDAAAGMGFTLNVVEPHLNGPLGDMPAIIRVAGEDPTVVCGQGIAPAGATIEHYRQQGLDMVPGAGLLATVVPGAFDAWMLMLRDHGRLTLRQVMEPAIHYARHGHPLLPRVAATIAGQADFFASEWPTSAAVWAPNGRAPQPGSLFRNPDLAAFWDRLVTEAEAESGRIAQIDAARRIFAEGFVAETIDRFVAKAELMDGLGARRLGVLTGQDMADWRARYEPTVSVSHHGWQVHKCGAWSQGPVLLQCLQMLRNDPLADLDPLGGDFVHLTTEALKRAFADRDTYYGDPLHADIPLNTLLSDDHAAAHRADISDLATTDDRPGRIPGFDAQIDAYHQRIARGAATTAGVGGGEPTMAHLSNRRGDTVHIDVTDRWGNVVSATPSGGWLQSNPVVPGLGVPLNTRAQMFWLDEGLPTSLAPGRRPRTTLSPSLAIHEDGRAFAFGTPGGDQQDQWQLAFFLRHVHHGLNLQEAIDAPLFHTGHLQSSFYPRDLRRAHLMAEPHFPEATLDALRDKGHAVEVAEPWTVGRLSAAQHQPGGLMKAAATPRLMQAYAIGR
ncbi:gamma-glutamyltransferase family protein [Tateyamaria sp. ANG-S1]|uniref:gamma-glutamyltransferase family protein n=1 Tax=Tateyamaria sp. ANG-S1 TaxID=1577905 RepID=UPI00057F2744|nr:gamma-glutamyltransferase family protein [Tateyamaria sp. ANG-S1]KIC48179.1 gamma-glutamyltransferase [Tateyamaria sp. ANG-S1]